MGQTSPFCTKGLICRFFFFLPVSNDFSLLPCQSSYFIMLWAIFKNILFIFSIVSHTPGKSLFVCEQVLARVLLYKSRALWGRWWDCPGCLRYEAWQPSTTALSGHEGRRPYSEDLPTDSKYTWLGKASRSALTSPCMKRPLRVDTIFQWWRAWASTLNSRSDFHKWNFIGTQPYSFR